ncbi:hypothetical protein [Neolewinella litorea]|uniref:Glycoside hydrolase family 65 n=1 Tax=Neolewinella litorea TaxID=2562452 RepID=A0A4V3XLK8_9BACT|nr:hypothetical protein [Neolewinella litorea]THH41213.1 hypothetical protein E4021_01050 [Neolewinella litorea]
MAQLIGQSAVRTIDRQPIVDRHRVVLTGMDTMAALSVGNGHFAMTVDATGLQTFPAYYGNGIPLGALSDWGWHSFPNDSSYSIEETLRYTASHGRRVPYAVQWPGDSRRGAAANYLRQNPHRLHLGTLGWDIRKRDGTPIRVEDVQNIRQELDAWNGIITTRFTVEGEPVTVTTGVRQDQDEVVVAVNSPLITTGRLAVTLNFPYPTGEWEDNAVRYDKDEQDRLQARRSDPDTWIIQRLIDTTRYTARFHATPAAVRIDSLTHGYRWTPTIGDSTWAFSLAYAPPGEEPAPATAPRQALDGIARDYHAFWKKGGIIDFGAVTDPRAVELERRMVLSRYLTHLNGSGDMPPQETGLTYNSWYGKPHLEMAWWHGVHFALWGQPEVLARHLDWYFTALPGAHEIARRQGFRGVRWQKMTDLEGGETSSSVGSYLLWQQPHPIYFAELLYRGQPMDSLLERYAPLMEATAEFMADFTWYDTARQERILGPGLIAAQERFGADTTMNTTFELAYWRWGLSTAQQWRERTGRTRRADWDTVLATLSPLPMQDSLYLAAASAPDSYTNPRYLTDHPSVLAAYGFLPAGGGVDTAIMRRTLDTIWDIWHWEDTWGWDFPLTAFTAARLHQPERAVNALLMDVPKNRFLANGHNYQRDNLRLYLPGNGGYLAALAMMAAGTRDLPAGSGFPPGWAVRWEGLYRML